MTGAALSSALWYSEARHPSGWSAQLTPDPPGGLGETSGEVTIKKLDGSRQKVRRVCAVPPHLIGRSISEVGEHVHQLFGVRDAR